MSSANFNNIAEVPAQQLRIKVKFDERYFPKSSKVCEISAGNQRSSPIRGVGQAYPLYDRYCVSIEDNTLEINFPPMWSVARTPIDSTANGYVDFLVEVSNAVDWSVASVNTKPIETVVYFNNWPFYVTDFRDLIVDKEKHKSNDPIPYNLVSRPISVMVGNYDTLPSCKY